MWIAGLVVLALVLVGVFHFCWALRGRPPAAVLPHLDGRPVAVPGRMACAARWGC